MASDIHVSTFAELDSRRLYGILQLRSEVFVVEQRCVYQDLDGRDLEPATLHAWMERDGAVVAALRVLDEGDARRIGRVCTHPACRREGLAGALVRRVVGTVPPPVVLAAQQHLQRFYEGLGFTVDGSGLDLDGIPHVPMRRAV